MRHGKRVSGADRRRRRVQRAQHALGLGPARLSHFAAPKLGCKPVVGTIAEASDVYYVKPSQRRIIGGAAIWPERFGVLIAVHPLSQAELELACSKVLKAYIADDEPTLELNVDALVNLVKRGLVKRRHVKRARVFRAPGYSPSQGGRSSPASSPETTMIGNRQVPTDYVRLYWAGIHKA